MPTPGGRLTPTRDSARGLRGNAVQDAWIVMAARRHIAHRVTFDRDCARLRDRHKYTLLMPRHRSHPDGFVTAHRLALDRPLPDPLGTTLSPISNSSNSFSPGRKPVALISTVPSG